MIICTIDKFFFKKDIMPFITVTKTTTKTTATTTATTTMRQEVKATAATTSRPEPNPGYNTFL